MTMNRREFLSRSVVAGALAGFGLPGSLLAAKPDQYRSQFAEALKAKPYLSGYATASQAEFHREVRFQGKWPKALRGTLYRNGPAGHEVGNFRYHHWFDGDGMIQAFRLSDGVLKHQAKMIETLKYRKEQAAGRAMYPGFGSVPNNPAAVTSPDVLNVGNISVLPHAGKLLALWEAGSPWAIDPETLETQGLHQFSSETAGVPFSAHPRVEPDGTLWNFGYFSSGNLLVLWHIDANGKVKAMGRIPVDPISMPHDFIVTKRHIVVMMPPLHYERHASSGSFLDAHRWYGDQATRVLVVDKGDLSQFRWLELPAQWVFHFSNGYEDDNGVIHFEGMRSADPSVMTENFRAVMRGELLEPVPSHLYRYQIAADLGSIKEAPLLDDSIDAEFPAIDPRVSSERHTNLVMLTSELTHPAVHLGLNRVSRFDRKRDRLVSYRYPDEQIPEEHLFVPKPGSRPESEGWVIGTAHDWQRQETRFNVFDFAALDAGPIASAALPYLLPLGLHGKFAAG